MDELVFTSSSLISLLSQIDELADKDIQVSEAIDGTLLLSVGTSTYSLEPDKETKVEVEPSVVDAVVDANLEAYEDMQDTFDVTFGDEVVEGGPIKELAKTLLIGGLVRLAAKTLRE